MDKYYIVHGTLNDYIDYTRLIEHQASFSVYREMKVVNSRPRKKKNKNLTNRRKVLMKSSHGNKAL